MGGDGLGYYNMDGRENIQMRGYENYGLSSDSGETVFNKFSLELRYPITLKPMASIYGLAFAEGGNVHDGFSNFNPFQLKRSAGLGLRLFMPQLVCWVLILVMDLIIQPIVQTAVVGKLISFLDNNSNFWHDIFYEKVISSFCSAIGNNNTFICTEAFPYRLCGYGLYFG